MTVAVPVVRALIEVAESAGVPRHDFLRRASLTDARLADGLERFTLAEFERMQTLALDLTRDEALGLHLAERASEAAFDLVGHLVSHAPTLREAFGLCTQFGAILMADVHLVLEECIDVAVVRCDFRRTSPRADRMFAEFVVAGFFRLIRVLAGPTTSVSVAYFEHPAPEHHHEYQRVFDGAARFNQRFTGIEFPRALLEGRQLHQHPRLYSLLRTEALLTLDSLARGTGYADRVKQYLRSRPTSRIPNMDVAARELGMSVRSLRRRLAAEGGSYRAFVQETLAEAATSVLRTPGRSVQEAAHATGFSDSAAFHRAFKQWTGVTPTEFQRGTPRAR